MDKGTLKLTWLEDPGHAWLLVGIQVLNLIPEEEIRKISICSYRNAVGSKFYLEEDCDAGIAIRALEKLGYTLQYTTIRSDRPSFVRDLERFRKYIPPKGAANEISANAR